MAKISKAAKPSKMHGPIRKINRKKSFTKFIHRTMKYHGRNGPKITKRAMKILNNFIDDIFECFAKQASILVNKAQRQTLTDRDIKAVTRLFLNTAMGEQAINYGELAMLMHRKNRQRRTLSN